MLKQPDLGHLCDITVELSPPIEMGNGRSGNRRIIPIVGGTVSGERLNGRILSYACRRPKLFSETTNYTFYRNEDGSYTYYHSRSGKYYTAVPSG